MLTEFPVPEPHVNNGLWTVLFWALLIPSVVAMTCGLVWTVRAEQRQSEEFAESDAQAQATLDELIGRDLTGRHASPEVAVDTGYVARRYADTDADTQPIYMRLWTRDDERSVGVAHPPLNLPAVRRHHDGSWRA